MGNYSIKQLESLSGIKAHTLRIWEQRYGFLVPHRSETNIRYYDDDHLKLVLNVSCLLKHGYKISHVANFCNEEMTTALNKVYCCDTKDKICEEALNGLIISLIDLNEDLFHEIVNNFTVKHGVKDTMQLLIYPFLQKIGLLWSISEINPAQEHFISCLIRQKIIAGIDSIPSTSSKDSEDSFLLFLKEGEFHEISLLFGAYLLKLHQKKVYYLGANVPSNDFKNVKKKINPKNILTLTITPETSENMQKFLDILHHEFPESRIYLAGNAGNFQDIKMYDQMFFLENMEAFIGAINSK